MCTRFDQTDRFDGGHPIENEHKHDHKGDRVDHGVHKRQKPGHTKKRRPHKKTSHVAAVLFVVACCVMMPYAAFATECASTMKVSTCLTTVMYCTIGECDKRMSVAMTTDESIGECDTECVNDCTRMSKCEDTISCAMVCDAEAYVPSCESMMQDDRLSCAMPMATC